VVEDHDVDALDIDGIGTVDSDMDVVTSDRKGQTVSGNGERPAVAVRMQIAVVAHDRLLPTTSRVAWRLPPCCTVGVVEPVEGCDMCDVMCQMKKPTPAKTTISADATRGRGLRDAPKPAAPPRETPPEYCPPNGGPNGAPDGGGNGVPELVPYGWGDGKGGGGGPGRLADTAFQVAYVPLRVLRVHR
jgi:hypothetical protein